MKRAVIFVFVLAVLAASAPLFAQNAPPPSGGESNYYYVTVQLEKIYPTRYGYILNYRKGFNGMGTVTLPDEWFTHAAGKAEIIVLPRGTNWPYLAIFYKDGQFSHVRLYVHPWKGHPTWGNMSVAADIKGLFDPNQDIRVQY